MSAALEQRIAAEHAVMMERFGPALTPTDPRREALQALLARGLPTARQENWRYTNLRPLEKATFVPTAAPGTIAADLLPPAVEGHARLVYVDGLPAPELWADLERHPGISVATLTRASSAAEDEEHGWTAQDGEQFALLNAAFAPVCSRLALDPDTTAGIEILYLHTSPAGYPRLNVQVGRQARLSLIERHLGAPGSAGLIDTAVRVELRDGAVLDHYRLQQAGGGATWLDTLSARIGRDAAYHLYAVQLGALSARSTAHIGLTASGAAVSVNAVSLADGRQVHDSLVVVDHQAPHTRTEENFRGIAGGRSRLAFNGKVNVRAAARGADSAQSLRGLIAGPEAEIDLRPTLEINTDEVRASHGATTGKLDENMLFYLLSRGLAPEQAQRLLKWAFITDTVARIGMPELRRQVQRSLVNHMQDAGALKELL